MKKQRTAFKLISLLVLAVLLVFLATVYSISKLRSLVQTVEVVSQPDSMKIKIDQLLIHLEVAENNMRAFTVSEDEKYYLNFLEVNQLINNDTTNLFRLSEALPTGKENVKKLLSFLEEKKNLQSALLKLKYKSVVETTLLKLDTSTVRADTSLISSKEKQKFLQRIFNKGKIKRQQISDSVAIQKEVIDSLKSRMTSTRKNTGIVLSALAKEELYLLEANERCSEQMRDILIQLQLESGEASAKNTLLARNQATETGKYLQGFALAGSLLLLMLVVAIYRDLIRAKKIRNELSIAREKAEELAASREAFLADMSHEMRTPLSAVSGLTSLLSKTKLEPLQIEYVKAVGQSSSHLLDLLNDLLDEAYLQTGKLRLEAVPFSPAILVQDVSEALIPKAREKGLQFIVDVGEAENLWVSGDPLRLKQILFNLAGNAIKYTKEGNVKIKARIKNTEKNLCELQLEISDTGLGMNTGQLSRLFERFEKGEGLQRESSGLGLYITRQFIALHNGEIKTKSTPGEGTTFTVTLPYPTSKPLIVEEESLSYTALKGQVVLIAEDDHLNRATETLLLTNAGAEVVAAEDGIRAWEYLQSNRFNIAFFDLQMPGMNGTELIKKLRESKENDNNKVPVYALTAAYLREQIEGLLSAGFTGVLQKPLKADDLRKVFLLESNRRIEDHPIIEQGINKRFNLVELNKMTMNDLVASNHFIQLFIDNSNALLSQIKQGVADGKFAEVAAIAHKWTPSCQQFKALELVPLLEEMATWGRIQVDPVEAKECLQTLANSTEDLISEMNNYLEQR